MNASKWQSTSGSSITCDIDFGWTWTRCAISVCREVTSHPRLFYAWDAISLTTMAAGPVSIHFVFGETRRPAGNCFATPVLVGRDATAAIVVYEMRETAVASESISHFLTVYLQLMSSSAVTKILARIVHSQATDKTS